VRVQTRFRRRILSEQCHYRGTIVGEESDKPTGTIAASLCDGELHAAIYRGKDVFRIHPQQTIETSLRDRIQDSSTHSAFPFEIEARRHVWRQLSTPVYLHAHPAHVLGGASGLAMNHDRSIYPLSLSSIQPSQISHGRDRPWAAGSYLSLKPATTAQPSALQGVLQSHTDALKRSRQIKRRFAVASQSKPLTLDRHVVSRMGNISEVQRLYGLLDQDESSHSFCGTRAIEPGIGFHMHSTAGSSNLSPMDMISEKVFEVHLVSDYARYRQFYSVTMTERAAARMINIVDMLYNIGNFSPPLRVALVGQTTFTSVDPIKIEERTNPNTICPIFNTYASNVGIHTSGDVRLLLTGSVLPRNILGLALTSTACTQSGCAVIEAVYSMSDAFVASVVAHELGHTLGMNHDDDPDIGTVIDANGQSIVCPHSGTIMQSSASNAVRDWSDCSRAFYYHFLNGNSARQACLSDFDASQAWREDGSVCGNGELEPGEACDCGNTDSCDSIDSCCDASTCQLKSGYECSSQGACCSSDCKVIAASANKVCRERAHATCDRVEVCDGFSGECPRDRYADAGTSCQTTIEVEGTPHNFAGKCYRGHCKSFASLCPVNGPGTQTCDEAAHSAATGEPPLSGDALCQSIRCTTSSTAPQCEELVDPITSETLLPPDGVSCGDGMQCVLAKCMSSAQLNFHGNVLPGHEVEGWNILYFIIIGAIIVLIFVAMGLFRRYAKRYRQSSELAAAMAQENASNGRDGSSPPTYRLDDLAQIRQNRERLQQSQSAHRVNQNELSEEEQLAIALSVSEELERQRQARLRAAQSQSESSLDNGSQSRTQVASGSSVDGVQVEFPQLNPDEIAVEVRPQPAAREGADDVATSNGTEADLDADYALAVQLSMQEELSGEPNHNYPRGGSLSRTALHNARRAEELASTSGSSATVDREARRNYIAARLREARNNQ